jgi:hypothetical protein
MHAKLKLVLMVAMACARFEGVAAAFDAVAYEESLRGIESKRLELGQRWQEARGKERAAMRTAARELVLSALTDTVLPAWMGTPWGLGPSSTADRPHQAGMVVGCSYFVTGVLQNAWLRLQNRTRFAQAPSLLMQQALSPAPRDVHRFPGLAPAVLERRIAALGDGVYIVGLNIHTGFLVVRAGKVRVVHASYTPPQEVVDEPLTTSAVIRYSRGRGYVVTPLFRDDRLIDFWLSGRAVPAPTWPPASN